MLLISLRYLALGLGRHLLFEASKTTQDTEMSTWKSLLDEFADEGVVDYGIHNHQLEKPALVDQCTGLSK